MQHYFACHAIWMRCSEALLLPHLERGIFARTKYFAMAAFASVIISSFIATVGHVLPYTWAEYKGRTHTPPSSCGFDSWKNTVQITQRSWVQIPFKSHSKPEFFLGHFSSSVMALFAFIIVTSFIATVRHLIPCEFAFYTPKYQSFCTMHPFARCAIFESRKYCVTTRKKQAKKRYMYRLFFFR